MFKFCLWKRYKERERDWDNCDWQKSEGVIYCDANKFPYPLKENYYDYVLLKQCLICFDNPKRCLTELHKFCKPNAIVEIQASHCTNTGQYRDLDVKHSFNEKAFINYVNLDSRINDKPIWEIESIKINPTKIGKFIPSKLRIYLSLFVNGLQEVMIVKLRAVK